MNATTLSYQFEEGPYGDVIILRKYQIIARKLKKTIVRQDRENVELMTSWIGFNQWTWLGIEASALPRGVTVKDVIETYLVARDQLIDEGFSA